MECVYCTNAAQVLIEGRMNCHPTCPGVRGEKNRSSLAVNPADFVRRSGTRSQFHGHVADLTRPGSAAVTGEFDHTNMTDAPEALPTRSGDLVLNQATGHE